MAKPIVVTINDVPNAPPVVQVQGAPNGFDFYADPDVATPGVEEGGVITLFGVDPFGSVGQDEWGDMGWRFYVPDALYPNGGRSVDIVWFQHDPDTGDLQVAFDSALPGIYYATPPVPHEPGRDYNAGPVTDRFVILYADDTVVLRFKPHTYRLRN